VESFLFVSENPTEGKMPFLVEGRHSPDRLALDSGLWISAAGSAMLPAGPFEISRQPSWTWLCVQSGECVVDFEGEHIKLKARDCLFIPPHTLSLTMRSTQESRAIWFCVDGRLSTDFMVKMGGISHRPMKQGVLPSQIKLGKHIVQATVRIENSLEASSAQLQQLLWGILASHSGQPVSMDAVLSHEIAKVVDAMRKNQYQQNFSLSDMAQISRMPVETFRKRFVSEVGMPPQSYQLFCKMERAKTLLKDGLSVKQAGIEVGMTDPYHFSKTFKNIVGVSPSNFTKATKEA
jgi:AraC-like DNA-binding protein